MIDLILWALTWACVGVIGALVVLLMAIIVTAFFAHDDEPPQTDPDDLQGDLDAARVEIRYLKAYCRPDDVEQAYENLINGTLRDEAES